MKNGREDRPVLRSPPHEKGAQEVSENGPVACKEEAMISRLLGGVLVGAASGFELVAPLALGLLFLALVFEALSLIFGAIAKALDD